MSYAAVGSVESEEVSAGCPGRIYLIDKDDVPSCADACPSGWQSQWDADSQVNYCLEPAGGAPEAAAVAPSSSPWVIAAVAAIAVGIVVWDVRR